jgi:hypothetical protein
MQRPGPKSRGESETPEVYQVLRRFVGSAVAMLAVLGFSSVALPQTAQQSGTAKPRTAERGSPHDLSGVWLPPDPQVLDRIVGYNNRGASDGGFAKDISRTPWGEARYDAAKPGFGPRRAPGGNDPILHCDPVGMPRIMGGAFEILQIPGRIVMLFESSHEHRAIWVDGRELPKDPDPTWYGYSVGRWNGDTLVVDTSGFNDKSWIDSWGNPHSDAMHVVERYRRLDRNTLELIMTIDDPKAYTKPLVGNPKIFTLHPKYELVESLCVPEDEESFLERVRRPAIGNPSK